MTSEATISQVVPRVSPRSGTASPRCCLYLRASSVKKTRTSDGEEYLQRPEIQEERRRRLCEQRGWTVAGVYSDGAGGRKEARPELNRLMQNARRGLFDVVAVAAFDLFARSSQHLLSALEEFRSLRIDFVSLREAIDTTTAAGMEYATLHGTRTGRSIGRQRKVFDRSKALEPRERGMSYRDAARSFGVSVATLHSRE